MLKLISGCGLLLLLCLISPKVSALSSNVVIYQLQTQSSSNASSEYVSLKNLSASDVEVTNWCLNYSSSSDATQTTLKCLVPPDNQTKLWLLAGGYVTFATNEFISTHVGFVPDGTFSAGIAATGGHVKILDSNKNVVDKLGWGTALAPETTAKTAASSGFILQRNGADSDNNSLDFSQITLTSLPASGIYEQVIPIDQCPNLPGIDQTVPVGYLKDNDGNCYLDVCDNLAGLQKTLPTSFYQSGADCLPIKIKITELLPNVSGSDTGKEFIEFYNPTQFTSNLNGYYLQLGPNFSKNYPLPDATINPGEYVYLTDAQSGVALPNSNASLRMFTIDGQQIDETDSYNEPSDDYAWALFSDSWRYTNQPSPGVENVETVVSSPQTTTSNLEPCPEGKYRNPETNRCKNVENETGLKACAADQIRNIETNRCRSIFSANSSGLTPCKPGQTRNPETNRCRNAVLASTTLRPCPPNQERNPTTNRCKKKESSFGAPAAQDVESQPLAENSGWLLAGSAGIGLIGYGVVEWREEISTGVRKLTSMLGKTPPKT